MRVRRRLRGGGGSLSTVCRGDSGVDIDWDRLFRLEGNGWISRFFPGEKSAS
jgi:hypothetical protein